MNAMSALKLLIALISVAAGVGEIFLMIQSGNANSFPARTIFLYILFFFVTSVYARITSYIKPVLIVATWVPAAIVASGALVVISLFYFIFLHNSSPGQVIRFGSLHAAISFIYILIGAVIIFGDKWMGKVSRWLKFGRDIK